MLSFTRQFVPMTVLTNRRVDFKRMNQDEENTLCNKTTEAAKVQLFYFNPNPAPSNSYSYGLRTALTAGCDADLQTTPTIQDKHDWSTIVTTFPSGNNYKLYIDGLQDDGTN